MSEQKGEKNQKKKIKKAIKLAGFILVFIICLILIVLFLFWRTLWLSSRPVYSGQIEIAGLMEPLEIIRDEYGVPHIFAHEERDLYRATGYVMAQDRLWQMDLIRRLTSGRLSEIFGPEFMEADLLLRALRIPEKARRVLASSPTDSLEAVRAFSEGVNAFIETHRNNLPLEFRLLRYQPEPWLPEHSASLIGYIGWDLAFAWGIESIIWEILEKLKNQEEKLTEILAEPLNPVYVYPNFHLPEGTKTQRQSSERKSEKTENTSPFPESEKSLLISPASLWLRNMKMGQSEVREKISAIDSLVGFEFSDLMSPTLALMGEKTGSFDFMEPAQLLARLGLTIALNSNNWAVSGAKTLTGKPLLANDMHLALNLPSIWYPLHQSLEGKFRVSGVALPGEPFIVAGHNEYIAWGITNVMADDIDFYLEKIDPSRPDHYFYEGQWRLMEARQEKIRIKGGKEILRELRFTHRGPIISEFKKIKERAISMRWTGFEESNELLAVYLLNRAHNWLEFREALRFFRSLSLNMVYADTEGNIGLQLAGGIPRREGPGWNLFPGELASSDWQGLVPFEELPFIYNPPDELAISANNPSLDKSYPHDISYFFLSPVRAERIREFLTEKTKLSPQDLARLQIDLQSKLALRLKPLIIPILLNLSNLSDIEAAALQLLRSWDGSMEASSPAATIFEIFYFELGRQFLADELGEDLGRRFVAMGSNIFLPSFLERVLLSRKSAWADDITTSDKIESVESIVERSFQATINYLIKTRGRNIDNWSWGKIHRLALSHPLAQVEWLNWLLKLKRGPFPVGGSFHTVCAFGYVSDSFEVRHGPSQRHIYDLNDWDESLTILPGGVSGVASSSHFDDQIKPYLEGQYRRDFFSKEKIESSACSRLTLLPEKSN